MYLAAAFAQVPAFLSRAPIEGYRNFAFAAIRMRAAVALSAILGSEIVKRGFFTGHGEFLAAALGVDDTMTRKLSSYNKFRRVVGLETKYLLSISHFLIVPKQAFGEAGQAKPGRSEASSPAGWKATPGIAGAVGSVASLILRLRQAADQPAAALRCR